MRVLARKLLFVLPVTSTLLLRAQFQQPTPEELSMTADPKAPGAAAVYLNVEAVSDDDRHFQSFYARIKVLEDKGKDLATVEIPFVRGDGQITEIKARTIHSDGTVIPLNVRPEDLMIEKAGEFQVDKKVLNLPSVEVGSILEYHYAISYDENHYPSPRWEIQRDYFVHKAHFSFTPFKGFMKGQQNETSLSLTDRDGKTVSLLWWTLLPPGTDIKTDGSGRFSLDLTDIPAAPREDWMPPTRSLLYKVVFYYRPAYSAADFWATEIKHWSKDVDRFAEPSKPIRDAVEGLTAPSDSELDKAKKLYKAVQALDNTDFSRSKSKTELKALGLHVAKRAEDTWSQKSGSGDDIALLYLAMLRAAGLTAYAMRVVDRDQGIFTPGYLEFDQLNSDIVIAILGGKEVFLDPGEKMCPFQTLHWKHSGAGGVRQSPEGPGAGVSPLLLFTSNTLYRGADISVDEHGAVSAIVQFVMAGQEALHWRQQAVENDLAEVKERFDEWISREFPEGVEAHVDHFLALDDPSANLIATVKAHGAIGTATSHRLLLPGCFFETRSGHPFVDQAQRLEPVDMRFGEEITDDVTYHLPGDLAVEGAPQNAKIPWEGHAVLSTKTEIDQGDVTLTRKLDRAFTFAKAGDYKDLVDFYRKVATADQQQLVLAVAPAKKGN